MKMFKFLYFFSTIMWGMFSVAAIGLLIKQLSLESFVLFSVLFLAILIEEQYYLIKEKIIDVRKVQAL
jgi:hypothetical protein